MATSDTSNGEEEDQKFANNLLRQVIDLFLQPELSRRGSIGVSEVSKVLVLLPPDGEVEVRINDEAYLVSRVEVRQPIEAGEELTLEDIASVSDLKPGEDPGDSGWVAMLRLPDGSTIVAFDFSRNKVRARRLLDLAGQFYFSAREATDIGRDAVAADALHTASELATTALMYLTQEQPKRSKRGSRRASKDFLSMHAAREQWLSTYAENGNLSTELSRTLRRLSNLRPAAHYGDTVLVLRPGELPALIASVGELLSAAKERLGPPFRGDA